MTTKDVLREFIAAPKPSWCTNSRVAVMCAVIVALERSDVYPGHREIGICAGLVDFKSPMKSIADLVEHGWLTKFKDGNGAATYTINFDKLPGAEKGSPNVE